MKREAKKDKSVVDFTKPIDKSAYVIDENKCFGRGYDSLVEVCNLCADNELCCILKSEYLKGKVLEVQPDTPFLDEADMDAITDEVIIKWLETNENKTTQDLVEFIMETARLADPDTAIERIMLFKEKQPLKIKSGILVWN